METSTKEVTCREDVCRFCLESSKTRVSITKAIKKKFLDVTQMELPEIDKLSNFLCPYCSKELKNAHSYRQKLIETQASLMKEISCTFLPELISVKQEKIEVDEIIAENDDSLDVEVKHEENIEIDEHLMDHFDTFPFDDTIDDDEDDVKDDIKEEVKVPKEKKIFKCEAENCGRTFSGKRKYNSHVKEHHKTDVPKKKWKRRTAMCVHCGIEYCSKYSLEKHVEAVHLKAKNYFCDLCGYAAAIRCQIKSHMRTHIDINERRKYKCPTCDFATINAQTLRRHQSHEHEGFSVTCHCGKSFPHKAALQIHVNIVHLKIKNHVCECGRKFFSKIDLTDHKKISHAKVPVYEFECEECGKQFCTRKQLMRHKPYHLEAKFRCNVYGCDKVYITEAKLKRHIKTHVGERDFLCHLCEKSYFFQKDLQRHLDVAHKQVTFFCELCSFTNSRKDYLGNHIRSSHQHISQDERNEMLARAKCVRNSV